MSKKFIDIEKAIHSKNPKLLKWMPGFLLSYIKNVTHESWMNSVMARIGHLKGLDFVDALVKEFELDVELKGAEKIPKSGGIIIAANHPLGGMDGIALMHAIGRYRKDFRFLVNDLLMTFDNFDPLFIPVNKHGRNSADTMKKIDEAYSGDGVVLIFPAGLVSRKSEEGVRDLTWRKSFVNKAKKNKKNIILCFIEGKNSKFFYNLASWRKKLGIKANLEMFYLPDEMYKQRGQKVTIHLGDVVSFADLSDEHSDIYWAGDLKKRVYQIGEGKNHHAKQKS
ncbi:1-acyl-sn-glycerol-3-phosphate acyltransferase [Algoriphagus marincola]|uniref:1-acyl-sn-glycerol-3-phosphate acyltransferase n=1 Tax=Algoriphagus marincola TaxID=264027 RepID=A0ABS7N1P9_9BACT|nr:1-acyl-sn-glycerol-3-phosphate acyltransferase [Algoriphagus marincola]MBY5949838.1 1-acyl-sn-glycerol-3-phosphate acyltransferase [Algoriphagus marincola]